jgi:hypothetical protein
MNETKIESCYTMTILSNKRSTRESIGGLVVYGGIGVGKNVVVKESITCNELITNNNAKIGKNLYVTGIIEADELYNVTDTDIMFKRNIMSSTDNYNINYDIGCNKNRWNKIYCNTIDSKLIKSIRISVDELEIKDNIVMGYNEHNKNSMLYIDNNSLVLNCDVIVVDVNMRPYMNIDQKARKMAIHNILTKNIEYYPQTVILNKKNTDICINSNILLIENKYIEPIVHFKCKSDHLVQFRVILVKNDAESSIILDIGEDEILLGESGDYVDCIYTNHHILALNQI